jgi:hypothetical protein
MSSALKKGLLVNNLLESMCKEAAVPELKNYPGNILDDL